jgi:hypothetical protein
VDRREQIPTHAQDEDRDGERHRDPETSGHVRKLGTWTGVHCDGDWFESHSAHGARARPWTPDLWMHGMSTRSPHPASPGRHRAGHCRSRSRRDDGGRVASRCGAQIGLGVALEASLPVRGVEVEGLSVMLHARARWWRDPRRLRRRDAAEHDSSRTTTRPLIPRGSDPYSSVAVPGLRLSADEACVAVRSGPPWVVAPV